MRKFESKVIALKGNAFDMEKALNEFGGQGWQLIGIDSPLAFLQRELTPPVPTTVVNNFQGQKKK